MLSPPFAKGEKQKCGLQGTVTQPGLDIHPFEPFIPFSLSYENLPPSFGMK